MMTLPPAIGPRELEQQPNPGEMMSIIVNTGMTSTPALPTIPTRRLLLQTRLSAQPCVGDLFLCY